MSKSISIEEEDDFIYLEIKELPLLWSIKLMGDRWKNARCPYCGGAIALREHPIEHKHCLGECERNYVE